MNTPLEAARAAAEILATADTGAGAAAAWDTALRDCIRILIGCAAEARGLPDPALAIASGGAGAGQAREQLERCDPSGLTVEFLGGIYQALLELTPARAGDGRVTATKTGRGKRAAMGAWYTTQPIAQSMNRLALDIAMKPLIASGNPDEILRVAAVDPACGAGVFLIESANTIAAAFARLASGSDDPRLVRMALPTAMRWCVFGVDIDPVAVDLAKTALWLAVAPSMPWNFMDRNIICGNTLDLDEPPALTEKLGGSAVRRAWMQEPLAAGDRP